MQEKLRLRLSHALLALLLGIGTLMPLLGVLDASLLSPVPPLILLVVVVLFNFFSLSRPSAVAGAVAAPAALLLWVLVFGGARTLTDVGSALTLRFSGRMQAVPLVAGQTGAVLAVAVGLLACFAALRRATVLPSLVMAAGVLLLLWLTGSLQYLPWALPLLAGAFARLLTFRHETTPILRVLPWAAGLVLLCFLLSPPSRVTVESWKHKADELRQAIMDRLFFTEPRDVFTLAGEGYYPQGLGQLGGKPDPSDSPVMQVSSPRIVYLRGVILNTYDGRSWKNTTGGRRYLWQSPRLAGEKDRLFDQSLPAGAVQDSSLCAPCTVSVRMLSNSASTLFVPQRVRDLDPGGELVPYFSNSSEIFATRNLQAGDTYTVTAPLMLAGDPGISTLINAAAGFDDPALDGITEIYTALPDHLEQPVWDLAAEVASAGPTPYEKAFAIQSWLLRTYRYSLDVEDQPENIDFVTNFLINTRTGYCTYFASAMTVLCRMAGLPARYVEGYLAEPDATGQTVVTGLQAHAWTEVYFSGFGWLTFDATPRLRSEEPGSPEGSPDESPEPHESPPPESPEETPPPEDIPPEDNSPETEPPEPSPDLPDDPPTVDPSPESEPPEDTPENLPVSFPWLWLLLILLLAALLALRLLLTSPVFRENRAKNEEGRFDVWIREVTALLRAEGFVRGPGESPMAFTRRVDSTFRFSFGLSPAGECLSLIRYSRALPLSTDTALIRDTARLLRVDLSRPARLRYFLRRIFCRG